MKSSSSFKSQMLGFYFSINGLRIPDDGDIPDDQFAAADAINSRAYKLLDHAMPMSPGWVKKDEHDPEITFSPYEVCEEALEIEDIQGFAAFSFWLFSHHRIGQDAATSFQAEVAKAYELAAAELGGEVKFLRLESVVTEEVTTTTELAVEPAGQSA
ncbi:hypothetical protein [Pseudomonas aeruginosa]|uniref:hypothetical protein n=1 Tax=Pseudomonas aeruginosa TaxID=287 RepID=UPI00104EE7E2|nr:hypothetical protein [Pseudomonas aeruginosa]MCO3748734.1 hypothetical protein [Pseudomonas aeruginosa]MCV6454889.1 hypothetical protein [Pseudomonas aeruginosa]HCF0591741.1 hypothetical protein [Pseudomonas aeruginosa]